MTRALLALLSVLILAPLAHAEGPCDERPIPVGPMVSGLLDGDLGRAHRACPRDEVGLGVSGYAIIETEDLFGHIIASPTLDGSWVVGDRLELFGALEVLRYDSIIAPIPAGYLGLGHTALGASYALSSTDASVLALNGKVVLPTTPGLYERMWPLGLDVGLAGAHRLNGWLYAHWQYSLLGSMGLGTGPVRPRFGMAPTAGLEWRPGKAFALGLGAQSSFGYTAAVDVLAANLGLRFAIGHRFGIELAVNLPLAGRERALAAGELRMSWRLGRKGY